VQTDSEVKSFNRRQLFVRDASPSSWLELGTELRDAAEELRKAGSASLRLEATLDSEQRPLTSEIKRFLSRPYLLLAGFAMENVLKGMLVAGDPLHVSGGVLSSELKSHDLLALSKKVPSLVLSREESHFCDIATSAIPYWGRYPIPLRSNDVTPEVVITEPIRTAFLDLFDRLSQELYWKVRDGWDSGVGPRTLKVRDARYERIDMNEPLFPDD
jgi:hypothetical protein